MQAVNKLSSYVSNKSFVMFPTVKNLLSIDVFSFSLICKSIAAQFLTVLCSGRWENSCGERFSFLKDNKKFVYQKVSNLVNISPFSSRGNIFRAYQSTLKIIELCFETTAEHSAIYYLKRWGAGTGFVGILPLPLIFDLPKTLHCTRKKCTRLLWIQRSPQDLKPSANNNMHYTLV